MSPEFFLRVPTLLKQLTAELFFSLIILLIVDKHMSNIKRGLLALVFSASLIVSHYAMSYIFIFYILLTWLLLFLIKQTRYGILTGTFIVLCVVMVINWYMYVGEAISLQKVVQIGGHVSANISDFMLPTTREESVLKFFGMTEQVSFWHGMSANLYRIAVLFICVGFTISLRRYWEMKFQIEYLVLTSLSMVLLFICIALPYFAQYLHVGRFYHVSLFFLSPFCIIGGKSVFVWVFKFLRAAWMRMQAMRTPVKDLVHSANDTVRPIFARLVLLLVLIPYFLFNNGFIYEITGDPIPISIPLSWERYESSSIDDVVRSFHNEYIFEYDVFSARWLSIFMNNENKVYGDLISRTRILPSYGLIYPSEYLYPETEIKKDRYIYLNRLNVVKGLVNVPVRSELFSGSEYENYKTSEISRFLRMKIYSNGESEVYLMR